MENFGIKCESVAYVKAKRMLSRCHACPDVRESLTIRALLSLFSAVGRSIQLGISVLIYSSAPNSTLILLLEPSILCLRYRLARRIRRTTCLCVIFALKCD